MVPNLPSPLVIPTAGTPMAPDADGAEVDFFAGLLGSGPPIAVIAGLNAQPADEIALRAAPAEGETDGAEDSAPDGTVTPDIIPLLQAQSGFPVAVAPAVPVAPAAAPDQAVPTAAPVDTAGHVTARVVGMPAPQASPIAHAVRATIQAAQATKTVVPEGDEAAAPNGLGQAVKAVIQAAHESDGKPSADVVGAAVKPVVGKLRGKPDVEVDKSVRQGTAAAENMPAQPVATQAPQRQPEALATRTEPVVQPAAAIAATPIAPVLASAPMTPQPAAVAAAPVSIPNVAELVVERQLDLANDNQWLDRLARDIARAGASDEPLRFRLHPQTLGHLQVELTQGDRGATVRLTVETEAARNILIDAQPRLAAEARAQGVRLAGTEVDLGTASQQGDPRRQAEARPQDIVRVVRSTQADTPSSDPAQGRSDRYA